MFPRPIEHFVGKIVIVVNAAPKILEIFGATKHVNVSLNIKALSD
jgi:hypothetical protein